MHTEKTSCGKGCIEKVDVDDDAENVEVIVTGDDDRGIEREVLQVPSAPPPLHGPSSTKSKKPPQQATRAIANTNTHHPGHRRMICVARMTLSLRTCRRPRRAWRPATPTRRRLLMACWMARFPALSRVRLHRTAAWLAIRCRRAMLTPRLTPRTVPATSSAGPVPSRVRLHRTVPWLAIRTRRAMSTPRVTPRARAPTRSHHSRPPPPWVREWATVTRRIP